MELLNWIKNLFKPKTTTIKVGELTFKIKTTQRSLETIEELLQYARRESLEINYKSVKDEDDLHFLKLAEDINKCLAELEKSARALD